MVKRSDIFLIHGIGKSFPASYYDKFIEGVKKNLSLGSDVEFHGIDYSHLLESKEDTIYSWMKDMAWPKTRAFACDYVGDALAFGYPARAIMEGDFIYDVNQLIMKKLAMVRQEAKTVVIGHSLGSVIAYNASWAVKMDCLITLGSPFCYFSIRYKDFGEMNPDLPQFHNFWRSRDPVSTIISKNPNFKAVHDYEVTSWNPLNLLMLRSHSLYWQSDFVHKKIAQILQGI